MHWFLLVLLFLVTGCRPERVYDEKRSIPQSGWDYVDVKVFAFDMQDTLQKYDLYITTRHLYQYEWRNMWVKVETNLPDGRKLSERVNLVLTEPDGTWLGSCDCVGDYCYTEIPLQLGVTFPKKGKYVFRFIQDMRVNPLSHCAEIGFRVEKHKTEP